MFSEVCGREGLKLARNAFIATAVALLFFALFIQPIIATSGKNPVSVCQENLMGLGVALTLYCGDYDDVLPSSVINTLNKTWDPDRFSVFASMRDVTPYSKSAYVNSNSVVSWPMLLSAYVKDENVFWCPSDNTRRDVPYAWVSYYWKAAIDAAWFGGPDGTGPICSRRTNFEFPESQIVLYERCGWHRGGQNQGLTDGVVINCLFMDGRVSAVEIQNSGYAKKEVPAGPLPASGVGEPAWFNYSYADNKFSKGQNWNPCFWGDKMREVDIPSAKTKESRDPKITCQSNLLAIGSALRMYMSDWDGALPTSALYNHSSVWNPDDFTAFASLRGVQPSYRSSKTTWPMALNLYLRGLGKSNAIWCPLDDPSDNPSAVVSYYWKAATDRASFVGAREFDFWYPSAQMVLYERAGWHGNAKNKGLVNGVSINCLYLDGHSAMFKIRDSGYAKKEIPAGPLPISGVGEPAWFNYSYGSNRPQFNVGQNWDVRIWGDKNAN